MSIHIPDPENINPAPRKKNKTAPKPPKRITSDYLRNSGLYYLQRYAASSGHFRSVMMRKIRKSCAHHKEQNLEDCVKLLESLIGEITEMGLLNDESYGYAMVTSLRRRGMSKAQIIQKLTMKSMKQDQIQAYLERFNNAHDLEQHETEKLSALKYAQKKRLGPFRKDTHEEFDKNKELAKLARAGFNYDLAVTILDMPRQEAESVLYDSVL